MEFVADEVACRASAGVQEPRTLIPTVWLAFFFMLTPVYLVLSGYACSEWLPYRNNPSGMGFPKELSFWADRYEKIGEEVSVAALVMTICFTIAYCVQIRNADRNPTEKRWYRISLW